MNKQNSLNYKGYQGSIEFSLEDKVLTGKLLFIKDSITYEGETLGELEDAFQCAVDDYLEFCQEEGTDPAKPLSGTFNVRIGPERHLALAKLAFKKNSSINQLMCQAVNKLLDNPNNASIHHHYLLGETFHSKQTLPKSKSSSWRTEAKPQLRVVNK